MLEQIKVEIYDPNALSDQSIRIHINFFNRSNLQGLSWLETPNNSTAHAAESKKSFIRKFFESENEEQEKRNIEYQNDSKLERDERRWKGKIY